MSIDATCSGCGKTLRTADDCVGRKARCPSCGTIYVVGSTTLAANPAALPEINIAETTYLDPARYTNLDVTETDQETQSTPSQPKLFNTLPNSTIESPKCLYFVRVPSGEEFGPADSPTVHDWIQQGRLDDRCHIRSENSEQWIGIPAWQLLQKKKAAAKNVHSSSPQSLVAPVSSNQSAAGGANGRGLVVLVLGVLSWIMCFSLIGGVVCAVIAIPLGLNELKKIKQGESPISEKWLVMIGIGLSIANLIASVLFVLVFVIVSIANA